MKSRLVNTVDLFCGAGGATSEHWFFMILICVLIAIVIALSAMWCYAVAYRLVSWS